jgi:hypothetical protein
MTKLTMTVHEAVELMKQEGSRLATPIPVDGMTPMTFDCTFSSERATANDINGVLPNCPRDLWDFWCEARSARLFVDQQYGQWGLEILDPPQAGEATNEYGKERKADYVDGDIIIGRFLGDSDLLLVRCDHTSMDYGNVLVALPLDRRSDWYRVADSFGSFLDKYVRSGGEKYWTGRG